MKPRKSYLRVLPTLLLSSLTLFGSFTPALAQLQPIVPILEEVIVNTQAQRATAYFGYHNPNASAVTFNVGEPNNYFFPSPQDRGQVTRFLPGTHHYVFAAVFDYTNDPAITRILNGNSVTADSADAGGRPTNHCLHVPRPVE